MTFRICKPSAAARGRQCFFNGDSEPVDVFSQPGPFAYLTGCGSSCILTGLLAFWKSDAGDCGEFCTSGFQTQRILHPHTLSVLWACQEEAAERTALVWSAPGDCAVSRPKELKDRGPSPGRPFGPSAPSSQERLCVPMVTVSSLLTPASVAPFLQPKPGA